MKEKLLFCLCMIVFLAGCSSLNHGGNYPTQTKESCVAGGAVGKVYPSSCHDECSILRSSPNSVKCDQGFSYGCDCGPNRCWNGNSCEVTNSSLNSTSSNAVEISGESVSTSCQTDADCGLVDSSSNFRFDPSTCCKICGGEVLDYSQSSWVAVNSLSYSAAFNDALYKACPQNSQLACPKLCMANQIVNVNYGAICVQEACQKVAK